MSNGDKTDTGGGAGKAIEIGVTLVKGVKDALSGKEIDITSDTISVETHHCPENICKWQDKEYPWLMEASYNWPIKGWHAAEVHAIIAFSYNGCDVANARILINRTKSFNKWYNDSATYIGTAHAMVSKVSGPTGCPDCCSTSSCVVFDVDLNITIDWIRTGGYSWKVTVCGNGDVNIEQR